MSPRPTACILAGSALRLPQLGLKMGRMANLPNGIRRLSSLRVLARGGPIALAMSAASFVTSCTGDAASDERAARSDATANAAMSAEYEFPPGSAQALSITGAASLLEAGQEMTAVNCAAAIHVTSNLLRDMAQGSGHAEQAALEQAEAIYRQRALAIDTTSATRKGEAIDEQIELAQVAPASQARLAVACLRQVSSQG